MTGFLADLTTAASLVVGAAVWARTLAWAPAVLVLLDLLLAASLLRLAATDSWTAIAGAAAVVAIRVFVRLRAPAG